MRFQILPGKPEKLGATFDGKGVFFGIYSERATGVELCLFEGAARTPFWTARLPDYTGYVWNGYVPNLRPGQLYGFRVHGPYEPERGLRFNPAKLLIDPYAKALCGRIDWNAPIFAYRLGEEDLTKDEQDNAWGVPKGVVVDDHFEWEGDRRLEIPWNDTVIYEAHVKGFTKLHPDVPPELRGTYAGLGSPAAIEYLRKLGITAIELLPVHDFLQDKHLLDRGLANYWGYNTTNFFSPAAVYSSSGDNGAQVIEFKRMVKQLHKAGIEVILDVVYNHTSEGNHLGPTLSFRGIDNPTYYHLVKETPRYYMDYTGTGNSLNVNHPQVLKLIMDSLRYWVNQVHVDGFRFDLASVLARELYSVDKLSAFFDIIHQDPVLSKVKLIAEPWDVGEGGYQVGNFPVLWSEWNGKFRDCVRKFWKGDEGQVSELACRLLGSSDLYQDDGREPYHSINFVTAHDGFGLRDLVSYNEKHNQANGEENRDGCNNNDSWNCGAEGETEDKNINELRHRQMRNFLATLILSQGVPMICAGDEIGRTQRGNNNAYCQDNEISWINWDLAEWQKDLLEFTQTLVRLNKAHPNFRRHKFCACDSAAGPGKDVVWISPDGREMGPDDWSATWTRTLGLLLDGTKLQLLGADGRIVSDDTFLAFLNSHWEKMDYKMPSGSWELVLNTASLKDEGRKFKGGDPYEVPARSMTVFKKV